jgi:pSer/pThr/pTyr-binding forkhead associated (FHA) protein
MGILRELGNGQEHVLHAKETCGRSPHCTVRLNAVLVAPMHAELRWDGEAWIIRDVGSSNGTFVDGVPLRVGQPRALRRGSAIGLGRIAADFELVDDSPPLPA